MSNQTYNQYLEIAKKEIECELAGESNKDVPLDVLVKSYIRYVQSFKKLEACFDQLVHPQKRRIAKEMLSALMGKIMEVKTKVMTVAADTTHSASLEDLLLDLKLTPNDLFTPLSQFFKNESIRSKEKYSALLDGPLVKTLIYSEHRMNDPTGDLHGFGMDLKTAIQVIQVNERGRQGKVRHRFLREVMKKTLDNGEGEKAEGALTKQENSAKVIQRLVRGFKTRKIVQNHFQNDTIFLGMAQGKITPECEEVEKKLELIRETRKALQSQFEDDYLKALVDVKDKIRQMEGADIKEGIRDKFRQWYIDQKKKTGNFPDFPDETLFLDPKFDFNTYIDPKTLTQEAEQVGKSNDKNAKKGASKATEAASNVQETNLKSVYTERLLKAIDYYNKEWLNKNETENFSQKHDVEIIKKDKRVEVENETKAEILPLLQEELVNAKLAAEKDAKGKKGKGGDKKAKKEKGPKDAKGKKEKDLTAGVPTEDLISDFIAADIIQRPIPTKISDYKGEFKIFGKNNIPSPGELRQIIVESCILPLVCDGISNTVNTPCSIIIMGPRGTGKTMLVNSIVSESGATLYNITPSILNLSEMKDNLSKTLNTTFKLARLTPPSVIYIDEVETIFAKKPPKDETILDVRKIKKELVKYIQNIRPEEHILVAVTTNKPWDVDQKSLLGAFGRVLVTSTPDYSSRYLLFKEIMDGHGIPTDIHSSVSLSCLARYSSGYSFADIIACCNDVIAPRRLKQSKFKPFTTMEFLRILTAFDRQENANQLFMDVLDKNAAQKAEEAAKAKEK